MSIMCIDASFLVLYFSRTGSVMIILLFKATLLFSGISLFGRSSSAMDVDKFTTPATICGYLPLTKIRDYAVLDLVSILLAIGVLRAATSVPGSPFRSC